MVSWFLPAWSTTSNGEHSCRPVALYDPSMDRISPGKRDYESTGTSVRRTTIGFGEIVIVNTRGVTHGQREFWNDWGETSTLSSQSPVYWLVSLVIINLCTATPKVLSGKRYFRCGVVWIEQRPAFSCYAVDAFLVKTKRRLDINAKNTVTSVYDTKHNTARSAARIAAKTTARSAARIAARTAQEVLMGFAISESAGARELSGTDLNP
jgi:hypothetical protein